MTARQPNAPQWIVCQIGAREHYAIPRALHDAGLLDTLITDLWVPPRSLMSRLPGRLGERLRGRFDGALASAQVRHFTGALAHPGWRAHKQRWRTMERRNAWFQAQAAQEIRRLAACRTAQSFPRVVFAYSYAARDILKEARAHGFRTVLGQIDAGPCEDSRIAKLVSDRDLARASRGYWENWHEECSLAERIVVNSNWSRDLVAEAGVAPEKIMVVPLIHEPPQHVQTFERTYPKAFDRDRPLRVLFLGTLSPRKGIFEALDAAEHLQGAPVQFRFVGMDVEHARSRADQISNVIWERAIPRRDVAAFYRWADVFLFPTHSDGFGITQLEAQSWGLPVVSSQFCGDVVADGVTGIRLPEVSGTKIAETLHGLLETPHRLAAMSRAARAACRSYSSDSILPMLLQCADQG